MPENEPIFSAEDLPVLSQAVSMMPNLEFASYAASRAKELLQFPINSAEEFAPLFEIDNLPTRIENRGFRLDHVEKFYPQELFPINDARDFLGKTLAALSWGSLYHHYEDACATPQNYYRRYAPQSTSLQEV